MKRESAHGARPAHGCVLARHGPDGRPRSRGRGLRARPRPLPAVNAQRVLVTGATGLLGRALLDRLHALGVDATGTSRTADSAAVVRADLLDPDQVASALEQVAPAVVVHLVGSATGDARAAVTRLGDQRQVGRKRIVVRRARRGLVGVGARELVRRDRFARRRLASVGIDRRHLDRPLVGDRLHFGLFIAKRVQVAERHQAQPMAGRAHFLVDLESALQLLLVELAERAVAGQRQRLGLAMELMLGGRQRRLLEIDSPRRNTTTAATPAKPRPTRKAMIADHVACRPFIRRPRARSWRARTERFPASRRAAPTP